MELVSGLPVDWIVRIKAIKRVAEVNRSKHLTCLIKLAPDCHKHCNDGSPVGLGQGSDTVGHTIFLSRDMDSLPMGN